MNIFYAKIKSILKVVAQLSILALIMYLLIAANRQQNEKPFENLVIDIDYQEGNYFINKEEIEAAFYKLFPDTHRLLMSEVALKKLEDALKKNHFVKELKVYSDAQKTIYINIVQKSALFRLINKNNVSFYLDKNGFKMPLSDNFTPRVIVITGNVNTFNDTMKNHQQLQALYQFVQQIQADSMLNAVSDQIHINERQEVEIYPKLINANFLLGSLNQATENLRKIKIFYNEILSTDTISEFNTINLKFKNQIVCSKN